MALNIQLQYFLRSDGKHTEDDDGNPITIYTNRYLYESVIPTQQTAWTAGIEEALDFMDIEFTDIERLEPKQAKAFRVHTAPESNYVIVWAKIQ